MGILRSCGYGNRNILAGTILQEARDRNRELADDDRHRKTFFLPYTTFKRYVLLEQEPNPNTGFVPSPTI